MSDHKNNMAADDALISSPEATTLPDQADCPGVTQRQSSAISSPNGFVLPVAMASKAACKSCLLSLALIVVCSA